MNYADYAKTLGLAMTSAPTTRDTGDWAGDSEAAHWLVTITAPRGSMLTTTYSMGSGYRRWTKKGAAAVRKVAPCPPLTAPAPGFFDNPEVPTAGDRVQFVAARRSLMVDGLLNDEGNTEPTPPELPDVLCSLAMDASSYDNADGFEDFAAEMGYDEDSRKAERIYRACGQTYKDLRSLGCDMGTLFECEEE